jgi:hypothetical protein
MAKTLMLRRGRSGPFCRNVRKKDGQIVKRLVFSPGEPLTLGGRDLAAVEDDIGKALVEVVIEPRPGGPRPRVKDQLAEKPSVIRQAADEDDLEDDFEDEDENEDETEPAD